MKTSEILKHNATELENAARWMKTRPGVEVRYRGVWCGKLQSWSEWSTYRPPNVLVEFRPLPKFRCPTCGGDVDECGCRAREGGKETSESAPGEMKPCPFCGNKAEPKLSRACISRQASWYPRCATLGCVGNQGWSSFASVQEAVRAWNQRAEHEISATDPSKPEPRPFANKAEAMVILGKPVVYSATGDVSLVTDVCKDSIVANGFRYSYQQAWHTFRRADDKGEPTEQRVGVTLKGETNGNED